MRQMLTAIVSAVCAAVLLTGCGGEAGSGGDNSRGGSDARSAATGGNYQREGGQREGQGQGQRGGNWQQEMRASAQAAQVPLTAAIATAATQVAGPVVGARLQGGEDGPVWSVQVMADTMFYAVAVSATTGEVLSVGPAQMRAPRGRGNSGAREEGERGNRGEREHGSRGE